MQDSKVSDEILSGIVGQKDVFEDKLLAHKILLALCESSLSEEMDHYKFAVQEDLGLDTQTVDRLFSLSAIARLLEPEMPKPRYYRGKLVPKKDAKPNWNQMLNMILGRDIAPEKTESEARDVVAQEIKTEETDVITLTLHNKPPTFDRQDPVPIPDVEQPDSFQSEEALRIAEEPEKNKHPAAKALRKLMRDQNVQIDGMKIDTEKYERSLILMGNTKPYKEFLKTIGGKWSARSGVWQFSKDYLVSLME